MDQRHHRISIHAPRMGSDTNTYQPQNVLVISIHAPRMGSDRSLSRSSYRTLHFNPRSPDGERRVANAIFDGVRAISIHAPRMGSDLPPLSGCGLFHVFQSTLPGWGATATTLAVEPVPVQFQSTLPGWGATPNPVIRSIRKTNFNPRSPDGERRSLLSLVLSEMRFQSTLPGWGATFNVIGDVGAGVFQSTLPGWGATQQRRHPVQQGRISIHAPRVGSDPPPCRSCCPGRYFNPRSPGGERPRKWTSSPTIWAKSSIFNTDCIADRH